jgi:SnoaL-like polyketide cyclase
MSQTTTIHPMALPGARDHFWTTWVALWNGRYDLAAEIIAPEFRIHVNRIDRQSDPLPAGPEGLVGWIKQSAAAFSGLTFTTTVGPIADDEHLAGQWHATGTYVGGMPGVIVPEGSPVTFNGTDILRIANGKATDYWSEALSAELRARGFTLR